VHVVHTSNRLTREPRREGELRLAPVDVREVLYAEKCLKVLVTGTVWSR